MNSYFTFTSVIIAAFLAGPVSGFGQADANTYSTGHEPHYPTDSIYIKGRVVDASGKPVAGAYVLFSPFWIKKFDVDWYEKDTTLSGPDGYFEVRCTLRQLFRDALFFKSGGYFTAHHAFHRFTSQMQIDTSIVLHSRSGQRFDTKKMSAGMVGMTVGDAFDQFGFDLGRSEPVRAINSDKDRVRGLRTEAADSSMILFLTDDREDPMGAKIAMRARKIIGIGVAYTDGNIDLFGAAVRYKRRVYNDYYRERADRTD